LMKFLYYYSTFFQAINKEFVFRLKRSIDVPGRVNCLLVDFLLL